MYNIDYSSKDTIYRQIVDQTKDAIFMGYFKEGDKMPSVRELSKELLVNQSTVTRAYRELENMGILTTVVGKGTFINIDKSRESLERKSSLENLEKALRDSVYYGLSKPELISIYDRIQEGENVRG